MSIQFKDYTSKKTGTTTRKFYAAVWDAQQSKLITGPYHDIPGPKLPSINKLPKALKQQLKLDEAALIEAIQSGKVEKKAAGIKLDEVAKLWLETCKPPAYSETTYQVYQYFYKHYLREVFGDRPINKVSSVHIQRYINEVKTIYSAETVNKCINILVNIFAYAVEPLHEIITSPAAGVRRLKTTPAKRNTWNEEEIQYFLSLPSVQESNYYAMFCISLLLGPRPSEVCGLAEDSLRDNPKQLLFYRSYNRHGSIDQHMKTFASHRPLPIPDELYRLIRRQLLRKKEIQLADRNFARNDFLFVSEHGNPIKPNTYSKAFKRLLRQHNQQLENLDKIPEGARLLPDITLYGCRHSFATNSLAQNNDAALISSIMGNSVKTLLTFYAHPNQERQRDMINEYTDKTLKNVSGSNV